MPDWVMSLVDGWPFAWIYLFFVLGAAVRSQSLYWVGRGVTTGAGRTRLAARMQAPQVRRATEAVERWGMPIVPLSFLTVGFQSAVHASCGLLRLRWLRYTLWSLPGWLVWALIWAGGGTAALWGAVLLAAKSPWALAGALVAASAAVTVTVLEVRRRRAQREALEALADEAKNPRPDRAGD